MRSAKLIRAAKTGCIAMSAILCALGIVLIATPELSMRWIGVIVGIVLIVFGAVRLTGYFSRDLYRLAFQFDLAFGILQIVLGAVVLMHTEHILSLLCMVLGVAVLADGLFKVQTALDARRFGLKTWWLILALALFAVAAGLALVLHPAQSVRLLTVLLGVSLLTEGILSLSVALCAVKVIREKAPIIVEPEE